MHHEPHPYPRTCYKLFEPNVFQVRFLSGCCYTRYKNIRGCGSIMKAAAIAVHASAVRLRATAAPEPAEAAELTVPRYQQLGLRPANALTDLVHTEIANLVKSQVVPPPPPPNPPTPPPPEPANPQYYLNRRHISGRDRWHHQRFGRSLSADLRPQPESMLFTGVGRVRSCATSMRSMAPISCRA